MSWRVVVIHSRAKLDLKLGYLAVRTEDETTRIHLSEIAVLMIESTAVSLTAALLCELARRKIDVIFCDEKRCPFGSFLPFGGSHDTALRVRQQAAWTADAGDAVWQQIVSCKIFGQMQVLAHACMPEAAQMMAAYMAQVEPGDRTNREGPAAKVYFGALFGKGFSRESDTPVNASLNYGYSVLMSAVAREIASLGCVNQLGVFHRNRFNAYNLACDLMEPFRPFFDWLVCQMRPTQFERAEKMTMVGALNRVVRIADRQQTLLQAIRIFVRSALDAMDHGDAALLCFPDYELSIYESDRLL